MGQFLIGAGNVGGEIARLLLEDHRPVRVLARDPARLGALTGHVEVARGDLLQPDTLPAAFAGIERAFILIPTIHHIPTAAADPTLLAQKQRNDMTPDEIAAWTTANGACTVAP